MSDIRISTITKVGKLSIDFDLKDLFDKLQIDEDIKYVEYGDTHVKGITKKKKKPKSTTTKRKNYFYNQLSMLVFSDKLVNVKLFNNGSIQMTGIKNDRMSYEVVDILIQKFTDIYNTDIKILDIDTVLINSDFDYGYCINNYNLHELLESANYYSSYEPCSYPGVNIKYYHNLKDKDNQGICQCAHDCIGKGKGDDCKRITIAVFKSGKIIITGGKSIEQIYIARDFIKNFIYKNKEDVLLDYVDYIKMIQKNYRIYRNNKLLTESTY